VLSNNVDEQEDKNRAPLGANGKIIHEVNELGM
jgi:hypothetical protein